MRIAVRHKANSSASARTRLPTFLSPDEILGHGGEGIATLAFGGTALLLLVLLRVNPAFDQAEPFPGPVAAFSEQPKDRRVNWSGLPGKRFAKDEADLAGLEDARAHRRHDGVHDVVVRRRLRLQRAEQPVGQSLAHGGSRGSRRQCG
jgi:hypothetical protein